MSSERSSWGKVTREKMARVYETVAKYPGLTAVGVATKMGLGGSASGELSALRDQGLVIRAANPNREMFDSVWFTKPEARHRKVVPR